MNKALLEFLSKTLNLDEAGVTSLFNEDGSPKDDSLQKMLDLDKARVLKLQKGKLDEGYNKAKKEVLTQFESSVKEKFGIDSDKQGVELVEEIITAKTPEGEKLTEEQVKKHKTYLDLLESIPLKVKEAVKTKETEFNSYKSQVERKETMTTVKAEVLKLFGEAKVVLPADAAKAEKLKNLFLKEIEAGNYRIDNGRVILLNEKGEDDVDEHGNRKDFTAIMKSKITETFDIEVSDPKGSPGNKGGGGGGGNPTVVVKDEADFQKQYLAATKPEDKIAITQAWEKTRSTASN